MGRTLPAPDSTAGRTVSPRHQGRPGGSALGRCQPRCRPDGLTRAPPPPTRFPIPSPASGAHRPRVSSPACAGVAAVPAAAPGSFPRRPGLFPARAAPRGERRTARVAEAGALGAPSSPNLGGGPDSGSRNAGKGKDGAAGRGAGAAHQPRQSRLGPPGCLFLPFPLCSLPPPLLARAKWPWRRHARAGVSARGRKWRTSR